jgi:uncharacterized protein YbbK (DUF523 family)
MKVLVSACLLGVPCRYDGQSKLFPAVAAQLKDHQLVPICPEQLGGLTTPRPACEIQDGRLRTREGEDKTAAFRMGAEEALRLFHLLDCEAAILKARSPSCGKGQVYDGTFTGTLKEGNGILAQRLLDEGIKVYTENEVLMPQEDDPWVSVAGQG